MAGIEAIVILSCTRQQTARKQQLLSERREGLIVSCCEDMFSRPVGWRWKKSNSSTERLHLAHPV